jgi:hypothetical protein
VASKFGFYQKFRPAQGLVCADAEERGKSGITRARSGSKLLRPYSCRLITLKRWTFSSTGLLLQSWRWQPFPLRSHLHRSGNAKTLQKRIDRWSAIHNMCFFRVALLSGNRKGTHSAGVRFWRQRFARQHSIRNGSKSIQPHRRNLRHDSLALPFLGAKHDIRDLSQISSFSPQSSSFFNAGYLLVVLLIISW